MSVCAARHAHACGSGPRDSTGRLEFKDTAMGEHKDDDLSPAPSEESGD